MASRIKDEMRGNVLTDSGTKFCRYCKMFLLVENIRDEGKKIDEEMREM